jgi:hypothetical protein
MPSTTSGQILAGKLGRLLDELAQESAIEISQTPEDFLSALEFFIAGIFQNKFEEWKYESLDGIYITRATKTNVNEAEFTGMCLLISDQTLTPFYACLKITQSKDEIEWCHCKLGETTPKGMLRIPYNSSQWQKYQYRVDTDTIAWHYDVFATRCSMR